MHRKPMIIGLAASALVFSAGGAYAYWTATGTGSSTATVATIKPLEIKASTSGDSFWDAPHPSRARSATLTTSR